MALTLVLAEGIPAASDEGRCVSVRVNENYFVGARDFADRVEATCAGSVAEFFRVARRQGEEKFVVVASVQGGT